MKEQFERTARIIGEKNVIKLQNAAVIIFGVGGVGSFVAEGLARAGIGSITIVDGDVIDETNINRQIPALHSTIGLPKVDVMSHRIRDINPGCSVETRNIFFMPDEVSTEKSDIDFAKYDYVVDAVDTVPAKIEIITRAKSAEVQIISCMGTGNKLDSASFAIDDIEKTRVCPLARAVRREVRKRSISDVKVLYSEEEPAGRGGSISFVPSVAGLMIAGEVIKDIISSDR